MFKKILIANRGEIACRVIKTAQKLGIKTVAVYSDADREALHVKMADEAIHIGGSPANESYLIGKKIIEACQSTGAEAVHPGYGFLSENALFCEELNKAGIAFVGPQPKAIRSMGDKITSKKIAVEAGVSTVPGHMGLIVDGDEAVTIANKIGYPVMIKASAGGGGKGMRVANNDAEAREGFDRSKSEALSSFGDDRIFIEKFITNPRHIEIQILADSQGNCIYLGERECSIQRRNQKVIEEAPSPFLDEKTRKAMGEQAVMLSEAVDYQSAGTVEFIVDSDLNFYFLEMNTRLQVEHPVTELITGLDLVEQMLRVASGEPLTIAQPDVKLNGWAIESRLYAEDPYRSFLPSVGRLTRYRPPAEEVSTSRVIRNDTGVYEGGEISTYYDPMIAKLCTWAPTRALAIDAMSDALDRFEVEGVGNNIPFLAAVMGQKRFRDGALTTGYIEEEFVDGFQGIELEGEVLFKLAAIACVAKIRLETRQNSAGGIKLNPTQVHTKTVVIGEARWQLEIKDEGLEFQLKNGMSVSEQPSCDWQPGNTLTLAQFGLDQMHVRIDRTTGGFRLRYRGADIVADVMSPRAAELLPLMPVKVLPDMSKYLLCPMPGTITHVNVAPGDIVEDGQGLVIVEAMKMENVLRAEKRTRIAKIHAEVGVALTVDAIVLEFEEI